MFEIFNSVSPPPFFNSAPLRRYAPSLFTMKPHHGKEIIIPIIHTYTIAVLKKALAVRGYISKTAGINKYIFSCNFTILKFMKIFRLTAIFSLILTSLTAIGQIKNDPFKKGQNDTIKVSVTNINDELIPWFPLSDVVINSTRIFKTPLERAKFNRLRYNVLRVLPYAMFARNRYEQLQRDMAVTSTRRDKRKLIKAFEKEIKDMFNKEIKNLTITQGGILIKLIDRETGNSSYDLLKDMKGGVNAFFYQSVARIFGNNLKNKYDPEEDRDIENIIRSTGYYIYN